MKGKKVMRFWTEPRRCKYCRGKFVPRRPQDREQDFCSAEHRKAFWHHGQMPAHKFIHEVERIAKETATAVGRTFTASEVERIEKRFADLERQIRSLRKKLLDGNQEDVVTLQQEAMQ